MADKPRVIQVTDDEVAQLLKTAQLPSGRKISGVSKTVVAAASGVIPAPGAMPTFVFYTGDGSGSMARFRDLYIEAFNEFFLDAMKGAAVPNSIYVAHAVFTDHNYDAANVDPGSKEFQEPLRLIHAPLPLEDVPLLTQADYDPELWHSYTPLSDAIQSTTHAAIAYTEKLRQRGKAMKTILIWFSDGQENMSEKATPETIQEDMHRIIELRSITPVFIGFGENQADERYFKDYTHACGFPTNNVIVVPQVHGDPDALVQAKKKLRRIFGTLSAQVVSASKQTTSANDAFFSGATDPNN